MKTRGFEGRRDGREDSGGTQDRRGGTDGDDPERQIGHFANVSRQRVVEAVNLTEIFFSSGRRWRVERKFQPEKEEESLENPPTKEQ